MCGSVHRLQRRFPINDTLFQSGDIRDQVVTMSEIAPKLWYFWAVNFLGKFLTQFYKRQSPSNMWQSLVPIGQKTSEIRRRKKDLNIRSILQWPSASQQTGGHNKTGNAYHIAKKFAANIPYIMGSLCSKKIDGPKFSDPRLTAASP